MPGADYQLTKLLSLRPSVRHLMMYQQGCYAGGTVLCVAKDLAENNKGARVLVVCFEIAAVYFCGPSDANLGSVLGEGLFCDIVAAMIINVDPDTSMESPIFQLVYQQLKPSYHTLREPLKDSYGMQNSIFWIVHPGGWAILDKVEAKLGLEKEKLKAINKASLE
ncbi:hypothetical protein K1719_039123 [Acacia pycnantha]|nr:hypothetical protein K1719_039123 [Acacia pycnantha]